MKAKVSAQAQQVLNALAARRCHLTADEILENLEGIGTATVYRAPQEAEEPAQETKAERSTVFGGSTKTTKNRRKRL